MRRRLVLLTTWSLLGACAGSGGAGPAADPESGAIKASVALVMQSGGPSVTRVHVDVEPDGTNQDLTYDAASGQWLGTIANVKVGAQTLTITAYSGSTLVGTGTAPVDVTKRGTAAVFVNVYDGSTPPPAWDHGPIITSIGTSASSPMQTDTVNLNVTAVDPDGHPLSYSWSANCGGSFSSATSITAPTFTDASIEACVLTATVTSNGLSDTAKVPVNFQQAYGTISATAVFVPVPWIRSMTAVGGGMSCSLLRGGTDGSCRPSPPGDSAIAVTVFLDPVPADSGTTVVLADNCGGSVTSGPIDLAGAGSATFTWNAPAGANACIVTATVTRDGLYDVVGIGIATH